MPVTVNGVVNASSPESLSFKRFGMTFTLMASLPARARVSITGRFLRIGKSSTNMVLLFELSGIRCGRKPVRLLTGTRRLRGLTVQMGALLLGLSPHSLPGGRIDRQRRNAPRR